MKIIFIPLVLLMMPFAFVVVAFEVAKTAIETKLVAKLKEKNCG